ncbi:endoribonuclease ZC3H12A [Spea bombifrons]|uniref:endoribonuclease ZC3H12A n=1 Tax=Spea bombifrons TaxID=233779 RepID=UPI002349EE79|nr:endoribonuclease ZC3H12A [Spea bombifrons]
MQNSTEEVSMEGSPFDLSWSLELASCNEPSSNTTIKMNDTLQINNTMMYGDNPQIGYHSLNYLPSKVSQKNPRGEQDRSIEKPKSPEQNEMQMKVDFFRKLGYSPEEILAVLQNHGVNADTNTVLGELVKHGANTERETVSDESLDSLLVPQGDLGTRTTQSSTSVEDSSGNNLRPVVIDGSNVAMSHGNKEVFSCRGILLAVNFFLERGHTDITVFVPSWRKEQHRPEVPITDQHILTELEKKKILVFTPSRRVGGKRLVCYDDRFIVKLAFKCDGVIVSNDTYRDLQSEKVEWKKFIEERLLMYSFVNDIFMPPDDPLGRHGPTLDDFLRKKTSGSDNKKMQCPYGKKCTYGIKCKFYHPERINQTQRSVADELRENARLSPTKGAVYAMEDKKTRKLSVAEVPSTESDKSSMQKLPIERTSSLQKVRAIDKTPVKQYYNGTPEWYPSGTSLDSLSYNSLDSGIDIWTSTSNSYCDPSNESSGYESFCNCTQQRQCSQHRNNLDNDGCKHYASQNSVTHSHSPVPYFPYNPSSPWSSQNTTHQIYRRELTNSAPACYNSLPNQYKTSSGSSLKYWSEPTPTNRHQNNYPVYGPIPTSSNDFQQWPNSKPFTAEQMRVRTKLCAVFQPSIVDAVMSMFPQILDPKRLAAEIFTYKCQNGL